MSRQQDRERLVRSINSAARIYRQNLVGKRFMYVFDHRFIEVIYKSDNFRHLTGVATQLSAQRFYSYAARGMLAANQISFNSEHPYALCVRKIRHIGETAALAGSECIMLEEITTQTKRYKFGTTDLNFTLCMDHELDEQGHIKGDCYVVQSLRDEDCFSKSNNVYEVTHIFSRPNDAKQYSTLLYKGGRAQLNDLPEDAAAMLEPELYDALK